MSIAVTLDWLAFTFMERTAENVEYVEGYLRVKGGSPEQPRNGYDTAFVTEDNVLLSWNTARQEMGTHVVFAGSALRNICQRTSETQHGIVRRALDLGGRISRLDIAKDAQNERINLSTIWAKIRDKQTTGTARTFTCLDDGTGGITVYVGSRQSERFARIYDKAKESHIEDADWKRYELECKGMVARAVASILVSDISWGGAFDSMALHMLDIPSSRDYQRFFPGGEALVSFPKLEKKTDREAWIEQQCIPAIVKHYIQHPDSEAVSRLLMALHFVDEQRGKDEA